MLSGAAFSANSHKRYSSAIKHWFSFAERESHPSTHFTPTAIEAYVAIRLVESAICHSTLSTELAAMRAFTTANRLAYPTEEQLSHLRHITRGFRRLRSTSNSKSAFSLTALTAYFDYLDANRRPPTLDSSRHSAHSMRSGGATVMFQQGVPLEVVEQAAGQVEGGQYVPSRLLPTSKLAKRSRTGLLC